MKIPKFKITHTYKDGSTSVIYTTPHGLQRNGCRPVSAVIEFNDSEEEFKVTEDTKYVIREVQLSLLSGCASNYIIEPYWAARKLLDKDS